MREATDAQYYERCLFQRTLDEAFPRGAVCAVLETRVGRLRQGDLLGTTGRLFCSGVRPAEEAASWEYEILIDARSSDRTAAQPIRVWVASIVRVATMKGLWEADVVGKPGQLLRLNAAPALHVRPSSQMRAATTEAHELALFPDGLLARPSAP